MRGFWTPERVEILKEQWAHGAAARAIAAILGSSRNAVIGKARRLSLPVHEAAKRRPNVPKKRLAKKLEAKPGPGRKRRARARSTPQGAPLPPPRPSPPPPPPAAVGRIKFAGLLRHHCRYAVTADAPFLFCGHIRQDKSAYCSVHHALCHVKARPEKTDRPEPQRGKSRRPRSRFDYTWTRERAA